ncbi:MAG: DUF5606 domain-containing protein [Bacteroidales bacterium]|nr:DUF5606 domain-containing protein [Bacteroidales bacterium]
MKTNLAKILAVSGQHGLYRYLAQARGGIIAESLAEGKRTVFDVRNRITTLADISIFTDEGELKLSEVFLALQKALDGKEAPSPKAADAELKAVFAKAVPNYDADRFYVSHMRKIAEWYNELVKFASLDFETEEEQPAEA